MQSRPGEWQWGERPLPSFKMPGGLPGGGEAAKAVAASSWRLDQRQDEGEELGPSGKVKLKEPLSSFSGRRFLSLERVLWGETTWVQLTFHVHRQQLRWPNQEFF